MDIVLFGYAVLSVFLTTLFDSIECAATCTTLQKCKNCYLEYDSGCRKDYTDFNDEQDCISLLTSLPEAQKVTFTSSLFDLCFYYTCSGVYIKSTQNTITYRLGGCVNGCNNVTLAGSSDKAISSSIVPDIKNSMSEDECRTYCIDIAFKGTDCTFMRYGSECRIYTTCPVGGCSQESSTGSTVEVVTCDYTVIKCSVPIDPTNGIVTYTGNIAGDTASYICNMGHAIDNTGVRICGNDGNWDGVLPSCNPIDCSVPWQVTNGSVSVSATTYLNTASYSCNTGYTLSGSSVSTCQADGNWDGAPPICNPVYCGSPLSIPNGSFNATSTFYQGTANYSCNTGYNISGLSMRICQADGTWNGTQPSCNLVNCGSPLSLANGALNVISTFHQGTANYSCNIGYNISGLSMRICQADGTWNGTQPSCNLVNCGSPLSLANGALNVISTFHQGTANYSCNTGYNISGLSMRICQSNGTWDGTQPSCDPINCGPPLTITNGVFNATSTYYLGTAIYSCNTGYNISDGLSMSICQADGTWNITQPNCDPINCGPPLSIPNGSFNVISTFYQGTANYSCNTGYNISGLSMRTCQADGTWDGTQPSCNLVSCGSPLSITNGALNVISTFHQGTTIYSCDNGYIISGSSTRTCQSNGDWDGTDSLCDPVDCYTPSRPDNGTVTFTGTTYQQRANYSCDIGFIIVGSDTRTCQQDGNWTGSDTYCTIQDCGDPDNITGGVALYNYSYINSVAHYQCNIRCTIYGDNQTECLSNGTWSLPTPSCSCPLCLPLSNPLNGSVTTSQGISHGSIASYSCNPGYTLSVAKVRKCLQSGQWTSTEPTCDFIPGPKNKTKVNNNPIYLAPCLCNHNRQFTNLTEDEIITQLVKDTKIDTKSTALSQQKLNCKDDPRMSSTVIGSVGVSVIAVIFGVIFVLDCTSLCLKLCKRKKDDVQMNAV